MPNYKIKKETFKTKQRNGKDPDIQVTHKTYVPTSKKPKDYGVTKKQFHNILDKASQPIEKPESDSGKSET